MKKLDHEQFSHLIKSANLKPKLASSLRFVASTADMTPQDWDERELLAIADRTGAKGVLLIQPGGELFVVPYELSRGLINRQTGRASSVICDFCRTWQQGGNGASISFAKSSRSLHSVTFLCCADLACSDHVRAKTKAALLSRAQLREDLTNEQRVERLRERICSLLNLA